MKEQAKMKEKKRGGLRTAGLVILAFAAAFFIFRAASHPASQRSRPTPRPPASEATELVPAYFASAAAAQPFPRLLPAADFGKYPTVQHAYAVAAKIPGVLAQQPCYCHCDGMGHRSLLDCYASQHAAGCGVCLKEALFAQQMTRRGEDPASIRQEIIRGEWRNVQLSEPLP
jgi:Protein of unknown function with PCYCGC motif